ncbi:MAG: ribosome silencing factor [Oscillospiraceae bacterium]|nr:ribosome silencing factor [Oscillospiraceae bacterium]
MTPKELADKIIEILDNKKANNIKLLHVEKQTIIADYFIICTGNSNTQIRALSGEVEKEMKLIGIEPKNIEGFNEASWILLDFSSVIVHIFNRETRNFYNLEKLWHDSTEIDILTNKTKEIEPSEQV